MVARVFTTGGCSSCFSLFFFPKFLIFLSGGAVERQPRKGLRWWVPSVAAQSQPSASQGSAGLPSIPQSLGGPCLSAETGATNPPKEPTKPPVFCRLVPGRGCETSCCSTAPSLPAAPRSCEDEAGFNPFQPCRGPPAEVGKDHQWAVGTARVTLGISTPFPMA